MNSTVIHTLKNALLPSDPTQTEALNSTLVLDRLKKSLCDLDQQSEEDQKKIQQLLRSKLWKELGQNYCKQHARCQEGLSSLERLVELRKILIGEKEGLVVRVSKLQTQQDEFEAAKKKRQQCQAVLQQLREVWKQVKYLRHEIQKEESTLDTEAAQTIKGLEKRLTQLAQNDELKSSSLLQQLKLEVADLSQRLTKKCSALLTSQWEIVKVQDQIILECKLPQKCRTVLQCLAELDCWSTMVQPLLQQLLETVLHPTIRGKLQLLETSATSEAKDVLHLQPAQLFGQGLLKTLLRVLMYMNKNYLEEAFLTNEHLTFQLLQDTFSSHLDDQWLRKYIQPDLPESFVDLQLYRENLNQLSLQFKDISVVQRWLSRGNVWPLERFLLNLEQRWDQQRVEKALQQARYILLQNDFRHTLVVSEPKSGAELEAAVKRMGIVLTAETDISLQGLEKVVFPSPFLIPSCRVSSRVHKMVEEVINSLVVDANKLENRESFLRLVRGILLLIDLYRMIEDHVHKKHQLDGIMVQHVLRYTDCMYLSHMLHQVAMKVALKNESNTDKEDSPLTKLIYDFSCTLILLRQEAYNHLRRGLNLQLEGVRMILRLSTTERERALFKNVHLEENKQEAARALRQIEHQCKHMFKTLRPILPIHVLFLCIGWWMGNVWTFIAEAVESLGDMEADECFTINEMVMGGLVLPLDADIPHLPEHKDPEQYPGLITRLIGWMMQQIAIHTVQKEDQVKMEMQVAVLQPQKSIESLRVLELLDLSLLDIEQRYQAGIYKRVGVPVARLVRMILSLFAQSKQRDSIIQLLEQG